MTRIASVFRRAAVPLAFYYGITIALPLANGAAQSGEAFVKHAVVVLIVPLIFLALAGAAYAMGRRFAAPRSGTPSRRFAAP